VKKFLLLLLVLILLACLSGYLMSKPSLVGKIGISVFYKQYAFLSKWWQGAVSVFGTWLVLLIIQYTAQRKLSRRNAIILESALIVLALVGFYFTYRDFRDTTTHRWLKDRFHIGAYLFWFGWILISVFCVLEKKPEEPIYENERRDIAV
jgi:hypothetical protein